MLNWFKQKTTNFLVRYLAGNVHKCEPFAVSSAKILESVLQVADVILVEGNQRFSTAIKFLTQSTWSHIAIYVGHAEGLDYLTPETPAIIEVDLENGVIAVPLSKYAEFNTRICRPSGLHTDDRQKVAQFMIDSIGTNYGLKNVIDLARYLIPPPPVPNRWRRSMLALGSSDPTCVICSTWIAQAFLSVGYSILPRVGLLKEQECEICRETALEISHIRHHSLLTPRDFDESPYFEITKPTMERGFHYRQLDRSNSAAQPSTQVAQ